MLRILCAFGFEIGFDLKRHFALRNESSGRGTMRRPVRGGSVGWVGELGGGKGANALIGGDFTSKWIVSEWTTIRTRSLYNVPNECAPRARRPNAVGRCWRGSDDLLWSTCAASQSSFRPA